MNRGCSILFLIVSFLICIGCSHSSFKEDTTVRKVRIAVVLSEGSRDRWMRIMDLAQKNITKATDICPVFDFYDENSHDMMTLAYELAQNDSIVSVIGCENEENTEVLAYQMSRLKKQKPMFTFNTSQDVIRKYSRKGFMWGLSESDITQSEVILAQIAQNLSVSNVSLLACNTSYGQTFVDWFAFQASELGMKPVKILQYDNIDQIPSCMEELSETNSTVVCVPATYRDAAEMLHNSDDINCFFAHKAFSRKILDLLKESYDELGHYMLGVTLVPNPSTGFQDIYEARYGEIPIFGEAQLYDAIMITCLAYAASEVFDTSVNRAVADLLRPEGEYLGSWMSEGIEDAFDEIVTNQTMPRISGAIGELSFSPEKHTIIRYSTYAVQYMSNLKFYQVDYISREYGKNTSTVYGAWEWEKMFSQDFDSSQEDANLKEYAGNRAVLIASSKGWENYRHQADILAYYQVLKKNGFTDDEIILIMADDIANNANNPYPGQIFRTPDGENLYKDIKIDYKLDELTPSDLKNILLGKSSKNCPVVLDSDDGDNVLFVWSGHGKQGSFLWGENTKGITGEFISGLFREMNSSGRYRKLFGIIEACYAGSVAVACEGIPNLLMMTAANDKETSKAELYEPVWNTYMTNSFTSSILNVIDDPSLSIRDLYREAFAMTMGSHVTLYNVEYFGNVFNNFVTNYFEKWYRQGNTVTGDSTAE